MNEIGVTKVKRIKELKPYDIILDYYDAKGNKFYDEQYETYCEDDFEAIKCALNLCKFGVGKCVHIFAFNGNGDIILNIERKI